MMDQEHLHLLINEELYLVKEKMDDVEQVETVDHPTEKQVQTAEDAQEKVSEEAASTHPDETPDIPEVRIERPIEKTIPLAIFHDTESSEDLDLLQKIIEACKLEKGSYEVYANGFNKEVRFLKAIVFVEKSKAFYESIPYKESQILCSRPLEYIASDQQEKAKLWTALQQFV